MAEKGIPFELRMERIWERRDAFLDRVQADSETVMQLAVPQAST